MILDDIFTILIIAFALCIIYDLINKYAIEYFNLPNDPMLMRLATRLKNIDPRLQNISVSEGKKSFTINKKHVYICLKDENGRYYDENMLTYVILHEYAHVLCKTIDQDEHSHSQEFTNIFHDLLKKAEQRGLYNPNIPPVQNYCEY